MDLDPEVLNGPGPGGSVGPGCCFKLCDCIFCPVGLKVFIITAQCF